MSYVAARDAARSVGRDLVALVRSQDASLLFARFDESMKQAVPEGTVKAILDQTVREAPIGDLVGDDALPLGEAAFYQADLAWGGRLLALEAIFDPKGRIRSLRLRPRTPLPPDPKAGYVPKARLRLPFEGTWWVFWGGPTERQNRHIVAPDQRHAYDLLVWRDGGTHRGDGTRNEDYWAWGRPIFAPADGVVVAAVGSLPDNPPGKMDPSRPAGNHVVLDLGGGEYAVLAHLQQGSVTVAPGERVKAGQPLGRCGNSGNSSEPHLHFHLQDRAELFGDARGLPVVFEAYVADGRPVRRGSPVQGNFLRPASS